MRWAARFVLGLALAGAPLVGGAARADDLETVRACVEANAPKISTRLRLTLRVSDADGEQSESRFRLFWRRLEGGEQKALIRFAAPEDLANAAVLIEGVTEVRPRVHLYLPDLGKPQRVTSREQLEGFLGPADLGVDEIRFLLDPVGDERHQLLDAPGDVEGRPAWVLESTPEKESSSRYSRTLTFVDRELCIPLRAEMYQADVSEPRVLNIDPARVTREAEAWVPRELVFRDPGRGSVTTLSVDEVEVDVPIAPSLLTVPALAMASGL